MGIIGKGKGIGARSYRNNDFGQALRLQYTRSPCGEASSGNAIIMIAAESIEGEKEIRVETRMNRTRNTRKEKKIPYVMTPHLRKPRVLKKCGSHRVRRVAISRWVPL